MEGTETWNRLARPVSSPKYTFFAPHNNAFTNVTQQQRATFENPQLTTRYSNSIFSYHTGQYTVQYNIQGCTGSRFESVSGRISGEFGGSGSDADLAGSGVGSCKY